VPSVEEKESKKVAANKKAYTAALRARQAQEELSGFVRDKCAVTFDISTILIILIISV
jgi:hypothetical protein